MKILLGSDLHTEFKEQKALPKLPAHDLLILAGDIGTGMQGVVLAEQLSDGPTVYVPGNHEYYGHTKSFVDEAFADYRHLTVNILNEGVMEMGEYVIIGCPLYSALQLPGYKYYEPSAYARAIGDFYATRMWSAEDHLRAHRSNVAFIERNLKQYADRKCIVVTHWLPSMQCIDKFFENNNLNPYFANDLDWLIDEYKPALWLFGHTHSKVDKIHSNKTTRLVCNPRGYPKERGGSFKWKELEL